MTSDPLSGQKLRLSINTLAQEYSQTQGGKAAEIIDTFLTDENAVSIVEDLIGDVIFRFLIASAKQIRTNNKSQTFDAALERFVSTKTRLTGDLARRLRQNLKQAVLASEEARPKSERRNQLKKKQKNKNCYLCGGRIDEDPILDHVWPRSAGGGTGKSNLRVAHQFCEAIKADYAVCGDAPIGRFAFEALPRTLAGTTPTWWPSPVDNEEEFKTLIDDIRGSQLKIAVLGRQQFQCHACEIAFQDATNCSIIRRNDDEPWWFANVVAICDNCERK